MEPSKRAGVGRAYRRSWNAEPRDDLPTLPESRVDRNQAYLAVGVRQIARSILAVVLLTAAAFLLAGCMVPAGLDHLREPGTPEGGLRHIFRFAFMRPWILVPALWRSILSPGDEGFVEGIVHGFTHTIFVALVGGLHVLIGFPVMSVLTRGKKPEDPVPGGFFGGLLVFGAALMMLYGLFVWASCFGAFVVMLVSSAW